jgi:hypothetical protein
MSKPPTAAQKLSIGNKNKKNKENNINAILK